MLFAGVHRRTIEEANEILRFCNVLSALTGEPTDRCLELAKSLPPSWRNDVRGAATEGMTLDQIERIFSDTFLSAAWRHNLAWRDLGRAVVGAPTVHDLLATDEFGCLTELTIDTKP